MEKEIWKSVVGYEGLYSISTFGNVKSFQRNRQIIMNPATTRYDYKRLSLKKNGVKKSVFVHRLVAKAFIPNPHNKRTVNHKNFNTHDNRVENLEWCTQQENITHSVLNGRNSRGENFGRAKLKETQILEIRKMHNLGFSKNDISAMFNVTPQHIGQVIRKKIWKHIL